jgi:DNA-binding transcriptional LysR family regulator
VLVAADDDVGPTVSADDINNHPMIGQPATNVCQILIERRLEAMGIRPDYVFRSQDNGAVQGMVRSGMGRAIMPYLAIDPDDPGIAVMQLDPPIDPRRIQLTRRTGRSLPPAAERFAAIAHEVAADVLQAEPQLLAGT